MPSGWGRDRRTELLAVADRSALLDLADRCLARGPKPVIVSPPTTGMVLLEVREPVEHLRFHLGDVVVTRAEVAVHGARGWSMRLGDDRKATLAAAICDAEAEGGGSFTDRVVALCEETAAQQRRAQTEEWDELAPTEVSFEELD